VSLSGRHPLLRGVLAGAVAGLITSVFHLLLTERVLDKAIALEGAGDGPVSRETKKYLGGPAGQILFGISMGLLFAVAFDQGQLAQLVRAAAGDSTVHEVFHDARHMLGFPCH